MFTVYPPRILSVLKNSVEMKSGVWRWNLTFSRIMFCKRTLNFECRMMHHKCTPLILDFRGVINSYICGFRPSSAFSKHKSYKKWEHRILTEPLLKKTVMYPECITYMPLSNMKFAKARQKISKKMENLQENVLTIPNGLCVLRMIATPFLGYLVLQGFYATSLGIFMCAGFTDVIDGYIARNFPKQQTMIGSFLDPAADKLLIATTFITLTVNGLIPVPLTLLIIFRDVCLMTAGFYIRYVSLPPPKTLSRYFDVSFVTARLSPTGISKANTLVQLSLVAFSLAAPVFGFVDHLYLQMLWYVTAGTTVLSAGSYLYYKNTYKVIASHIEKKKL